MACRATNANWGPSRPAPRQNQRRPRSACVSARASSPRRAYFARVVHDCSLDAQDVPDVATLAVEYTSEENATWGALWSKSSGLLAKHGCRQYLRGLQALGYTAERVPDHRHVSSVLTDATGWRLAPVDGSISGNRFQQLLSRRCMPTTVHLRPPQELEFTSDPDCFHELVGHAPLVFDPQLAGLHHRFGLALAKAETKRERQAIFCVFFNAFETGLVAEGPGGEAKAVGASILSGAAELEHVMRNPHLHQPFDVRDILRAGSMNEQGFKPRYFLARSTTEMVAKCDAFLQDPGRFASEAGTVAAAPRA